MSDNVKINFNEKNIENIRASKGLSSVKDGKAYVMVDKGPAPCKVKVTKKSREICAKSLLK